MPISIISVSADSRLKETLEYLAQSLQLESVTPIDSYISPADTIQRNADHGAATPVVFISVDKDYEAGLTTAEIFSKMQHPRFGVVVASSSRDVDVVLSIVKSGYGFLSLPATPGEAMVALKRAVQVEQAQNGAADDGQLYVFTGMSGGVGTTTIASHVAVALASEGKKTILVDHHRELGHVALYLNVQNNGRSIYDLVTNEERLDDSLLSSYVVQHNIGLDVLCSPEVVGGSVERDVEAFKKALSFLRSRYRYVIFDSVASDPELSIVAAEAERVYFVVSAEVASMRDLLRYAVFYGKTDPKYQIVVNHEGRSPITAANVEDRTGLVVAAKFEELAAHVPTATNAGKVVELDVRSFHDSLGVLLNAIDPHEEQEEHQPKKSWFPWGKKR